jgi:catechol 2,3-dioxygenase-like lactoylglutathione lyase family enzyme
MSVLPGASHRLPRPPTGEIAMNDLAPMRRLAPEAQTISPAKFAHFVLRTGQIDEMAEWYRTVLGARLVFRDAMLCFLSYDDEHHRLALLQVPGLPPRDPASAGTDHVAYSYRDLGDLLSTYRRLKGHGILPHWPINHGVTTSMYYRDPDNNRVELQIDNYPTAEELQAYFHSAAFAANPVGVTYDPEELCRRYENGEAMADLLRIQPLPEGKSPWDMLPAH